MTIPQKITKEIYDKANEEQLVFKAQPGISEELVRQISSDKGEPEWMLKKRLEALKLFQEMPMPNFGPDLSDLNINDIHLYLRPDSVKNSTSWEEVPREIRQTYERLGIPQAERNALAGVGAQYECLSEDSLVFTNHNGPIKIKEIKEGDYVFSFDENEKKIKKARVLGVVEKGKNEVFEVIVGNKKIKTTLNHPFLTLSHHKKEGRKRGIYKIEWKSLKDLKRGNLIAVAKKLPQEGDAYLFEHPTIKKFGKGRNQFGTRYSLPLEYKYNKVNLPRESSEDIMWFLGLYLGDGFIRKSNYSDKKTTEIAIPEDQHELRRELKNVVKKLFDYDITSTDKDRVRIYSTIISDFIDANGFGGNAHQKRVPNWVFKIPLEQKLSFLGGYTDSDGYISNEKHSYALIFKSVNKDLINDLKNLVPYCNFNSSKIHIIKSRHPFEKTRIMTAYQIGISGNLKTIPSKYYFKKSRLDSKKLYHTFRTAKGTDFRKHTNEELGFVRIKSITPKGIQKVYDIEVGGYNNFVANGLIVHNSEVVYHKLKKELEEQGVIFLDCDLGLQQHEELFKKYFMTTCISPSLHKFTALHAAFWSGGTFIYIPKNVKVELPLQAYFRMNAKKGGQFEHTLIIADEGSEVHYIEGCSSPIYNESGLHAGCVEIQVLKGARVRYSSIENWSKNTYNLNTKRGIVHEDGLLEWVNGNTGCLTGDSKVFTNPKGPIEIKNLKEGDKVYVWDEKTNSIKVSKIKNKIFSGNKKVYRLEAGGRKIEASSNHPFLTLIRGKNNPTHKKGFFKYVWGPLGELKVGDLIGITKKLPHEGKSYVLPKIEIGEKVKSKNQYSFFEIDTSRLYNRNIIYPEKTNENFMWLMGLLIGDGYIDLKNNKINIATHEKEDYRNELVEILKELFNYKVTEQKERYIIINSKALCNLFSRIGFGGKAGTKSIPKWVFSLPEGQIMAFIAGYFDSDGHVQRGGAYFTSINKKLLENLKQMGIILGFGVSRIFVHGKARDSEILGKKVKLKDSWRLLFNGAKIKNLPLKCERKKAKILESKTRRNYVSAKEINFRSNVNEEVGFAKINKIDEIGIKPTFDIEVEDYSNFIANGLIVHNSKVTMLYPSSVLIGKNAKTEYIGIAYANAGQHQDTGCKVYHLAENTSSHIISKSICMNGGRTDYRGLVKIRKGSKNSKSSVSCDGLMLDNKSTATTFPSMEVEENQVDVSHEATIGKIGEEQLFYLMSRGLSEQEATKMIVSGFIEPLIKELPLEYAIELNRLIELEIENSVV